MVKKSRMVAALLATFFLMTIIGSACAWTGTFHIDHEWVEIWINSDGSIELFYNISITLDSGDLIHFAQVGQPRGDFITGQAKDQYGHTLLTSDIRSEDNYKVQVNLDSPLTTGHTVWFTLTTKVPHMIWEDNATYVGMLFIPTWWEQASTYDLHILIVLPPNVTIDQVRTTEVYWSNTLSKDGRLAIYWETENISPDGRYPVGVSFPKQYVQYYDVQPTGLVAFFQRYGTVLFAFAFVTFIISSVIIIVRKKSYLLPKISMETLGIRRGLTAVEASYLLEMQPTKIVTEILYSLLQKRAIWVDSTNPSLKLKVMQSFQEKAGTPETPLRYYEMDFLKALKEDGTLEEEKLAHTIMFLRDAVEQKMRGYCRRDTIDYYRKIVAKAWEQVQQAGTSELASKAYDEQLLWLLLDPNFQLRTKTAFRDRAFEPSPFWLWYWYSYQHYNPHPTYKPNVEIPAQSAKPPTIPGADFANNIATAVEKTSNNIVVNLEKFANAIIPMPAAKGSSESARHGASCVCACASCACVCACVSCACACASGGVG
jgi:hypothetical protein